MSLLTPRNWLSTERDFDYPHGAVPQQVTFASVSWIDGYPAGDGGVDPLLAALVQRRTLDAADRFPTPVAELTSGRIWERAAVEEWGKATGREIKGA
jgi:hypothetical protein